MILPIHGPLPPLHLWPTQAQIPEPEWMSIPPKKPRPVSIVYCLECHEHFTNLLKFGLHIKHHDKEKEMAKWKDDYECRYRGRFEKVSMHLDDGEVWRKLDVGMPVYDVECTNEILQLVPFSEMNDLKFPAIRYAKQSELMWSLHHRNHHGNGVVDGNTHE